MNLLICTQIIDRKDSTLGFFHKWTALLAEKFGKVNVVCLKKGEYDLPKNVFVHSLGKESRPSGRIRNKLIYALRFYILTWRLRHEYDAVFVHMNQEYALLGGILWRLLGKKVFMWRNHYAGNILTDISSIFCQKIFCTSRFSYTARYKKTTLMPVGVDIDSCHMEEKIERTPLSVLFLGRLDESKRPHILLEALGIIAKKEISFMATFVGGASRAGSNYPDRLRDQAKSLNISDRVKFIGAVPNTETYKYYRSHEIFVNCSPSGMLDKTIFKAAACGCIVLTSSQDFADLVGDRFSFTENDAMELSKKLANFLFIHQGDRINLTNQLSAFIENHSLPILINRLDEVIKKS